MNVLLCTPYNVNHSGIAIWAQNVVSYYRTLNTDINIQIIAYDRKNGVKTWLPKRVYNALVDYLRPVNETRKKLKTTQYDVLHLCTSASLSLLKDLLVLKMAKQKDVNTTVHFHFGRISELSNCKNWEWFLLRKVIRNADAAIAMDLKSYRTLGEHGFNNVHYLPNPLSLSIIRQVEQEAHIVQRVARKLCFVGHVIPSKGVYELVEACKDIDDITVHVVGSVSNEIKAKMREKASNGSWLVFEGLIDHRDVIKELLSSAIFVLPTYTEGFPNVILESMACGCAIVTTPVGAIPEILNIDSDEPCGLCSLPRDVKSLHNNIEFFLNNTNEIQQYSERSIKRVNEMYVVDKVWMQLVDIWKGLSQKSRVCFND